MQTEFGTRAGDHGIVLLHQDDHLLVFSKPASLLCVPGRGADKQDSLASRVQVLFPDARVVHRLDRDTSGVLLMARHRDAQRSLGKQFEARSVRKTYRAVVSGWMEPGRGTIDLPLAKDFLRPPRHRVDWAHGRTALTQWEVLARLKETTHLSLYPLTGRSHQLRVHLSHCGHPIVGDPLYGPPGSLDESPSEGRLLLHAERIEFEHPATGRRQAFEVPCPFALQA